MNRPRVVSRAEWLAVGKAGKIWIEEDELPALSVCLYTDERIFHMSPENIAHQTSEVLA